MLVVGDQDGFPFLDTTGAVLTTLFRKLDRGDTPRLVVPNPDLYYPEKDGFGFASGAVAGMFEAALALRYPDHSDLTFARLGKPHPCHVRGSIPPHPLPQPGNDRRHPRHRHPRRQQRRHNLGTGGNGRRFRGLGQSAAGRQARLYIGVFGGYWERMS